MTADARDLASLYYRGSNRDMAEDAAALLRHPHGLLLCTPELVVMMKAVCSAHPETWEDLPDVAEEADAWYIHLLVGDSRLARRMAAGLPRRRFCCFRRGLRHSRPHILSWERLLLSDTEPNRSNHGIH